MQQSEIKAIICGLLLLCIVVYGIAMWCQTLMHTYKKMKKGELVDIRQTSKKLFLFNCVVLISSWITTALSYANLNPSAIVASLFTAMRSTVILIALSMICIFQVRQHNRKT